MGQWPRSLALPGAMPERLSNNTFQQHMPNRMSQENAKSNVTVGITRSIFLFSDGLTKKGQKEWLLAAHVSRCFMFINLYMLYTLIYTSNIFKHMSHNTSHRCVAWRHIKVGPRNSQFPRIPSVTCSMHELETSYISSEVQVIHRYT